MMYRNLLLISTMIVFKTKASRIVSGLVLILLIATTAPAQKYSSDNGDGTYTNPLIAADFPDPDVILVGDTYYMVTTTMFIFPGVPI